ncbi:hypothetical protein BGY98DRAFT_747071 [Russula aff. rugulosa BPL654]|nr:hypothetical protein BGY98DRAFT_747071 [Russula aff. rugulosa BPL654]
MDVAGEPRLVGFNTGPGPEPGIRSEAVVKLSLQYLDSNEQINLTVTLLCRSTAGTIIVLTRMTGNTLPKIDLAP